MASAEVAHYLDVDRSTVSRWATTGRLIPVVKGEGIRGMRFFDRADVERVKRDLRGSAA